MFPFDRSIFDGKIRVERMRYEHPLEYARLEAPPAPTPRPTLWATVAALLTAPVRGALFAMFLPAAGFAVLGHHLIAKLRGTRGPARAPEPVPCLRLPAR